VRARPAAACAWQCSSSSVGPTGHMQTPEQVLEEPRQQRSQQQGNTLPDVLVQLALRTGGALAGPADTKRDLTDCGHALWTGEGGERWRISVRQGLKCIALRSLVVSGTGPDVPSRSDGKRTLAWLTRKQEGNGGASADKKEEG